MRNVDLRVQADKLIITVDLKQALTLSASGKTLVVSSTEGNVSIPGVADWKIGLNVYRPNPKYGQPEKASPEVIAEAQKRVDQLVK